MKKHIFIPLLHGLCAVIAIFFLGGCASNGYISSNITTGIGLDVSENSQTQVPHVRFGYIRNGTYYIPTGKTGDPQNGDASKTPHVVSKIHVSSEFLKGIDISEKFAVGDQAVRSGSAQILFQDTSLERARSSAPPDKLRPIRDDFPAPRKPTTKSAAELKALEDARQKRNENAAAVKDFVKNLNVISKFSSPQKETAYAAIVTKTTPAVPVTGGDALPVDPTYSSINRHFQNTNVTKTEREAMAIAAANQVKQAQDVVTP